MLRLLKSCNKNTKIREKSQHSRRDKAMNSNDINLIFSQNFVSNKSYLQGYPQRMRLQR